MNVILKNMIKNVCANKRRSIALVFCMLVVGFCAMFSISIQETMKSTIYGMFTQTFGDAEIIITNPYFTQNEPDLPDAPSPSILQKVRLKAIQGVGKISYILPLNFFRFWAWILQPHKKKVLFRKKVFRLEKMKL